MFLGSFALEQIRGRADVRHPLGCGFPTCRGMVSKVMESFVLDSLKSEVTMAKNQYGGVKGSGVNQFLTCMWDNILTGLEEDQTSATLMSVDFAKAFNRMQHQACLTALASKGSSNQTLRMIYFFLRDRTMQIRNGQKLSRSRNMKGGAPQGTKLGNILFCLTVENIEEVGQADLDNSDIVTEMSVHADNSTCSNQLDTFGLQ